MWRFSTLCRDMYNSSAIFPYQTQHKNKLKQHNQLQNSGLLEQMLGKTLFTLLLHAQKPPSLRQSIV
jgi:hypothetical protein